MVDAMEPGLMQVAEPSSPCLGTEPALNREEEPLVAAIRVFETSGCAWRAQACAGAC